MTSKWSPQCPPENNPGKEFESRSPRWVQVIVISIFLLAPVLISTRGFSQDFRARQMDPDKVLAKLTTELNLTPDQATKIRPIVEEQAKWQAQMAQEMQTHLQSYRSNIEAVLTDPQKSELQKLQNQRTQKGKTYGKKWRHR